MKIIAYRNVNPSIPVCVDTLQKHWDALKEIPGDHQILFITREGVASGEMHRELMDADVLLGVPPQIKLMDEEGKLNYPKLKYAAVLSHGYDRFDIKQLAKNGVALSNTNYGNELIAEYTIALLMEVYHQIGYNNACYKEADWGNPECKAQAFHAYTPQLSVRNKIMGIIGLGGIGGKLAIMAHGLGMKVISSSRHRPEGCEFVELVSQEELLRRSDVVSLNAPAKADTIGMINKDTLSLMKKTAVLINTARGSLIVEEDLADALENGVIAYAALDTLQEEPPTKKSRLLSQKNCIVTGHIAWMGVDEFYYAVDLAIEHLRKYLEGDMRYVVNAEGLTS